MNDKTLIRDMAALLCEIHHFARDRAGRLFLYKDGVYAPGAEFFLRQQVKRLPQQLPGPRADRIHCAPTRPSSIPSLRTI